MAQQQTSQASPPVPQPAPQSAPTSPASPPPEVEQRSMGGGPVTIPNTTTLAALLPLIYTLSADLTAATKTFQLIDGSTMLVTFSGLPLSNVRIHFSPRPVAPSTMVHIYPY
jgi:hypothetical protein